MYKQAVQMVLLVGVLLSAVAIANGGSLNGILDCVTTDSLYLSQHRLRPAGGGAGGPWRW